LLIIRQSIQPVKTGGTNPQRFFSETGGERGLRKEVSWSLTSPFSTSMAMSETKGAGWRAMPTSKGRPVIY